MKILNSPKSKLFYINFYSRPDSISPFIEEGELLDHRPSINRNYTIDNYEYITDCNKELIIIGRGGYGKIYLAKNKKDNKEYAIKYVSKEKMKSVGVDYSIIKREIDIHIRITHPRIIKLYSYLEDRYNFYLAMEYAKKGSLYQLIQQKKGMSENEAFFYFIQVASAIYFLHENGYAHRDIKPENILLDENGGIKLCDFGWCVNVAKGERTTFCGTYEYMAPEMINDEFYDKGIDIWSLGVLLYEMIHGYSPFRAHKFVKDAKKAQIEIFVNIKNNNYTINKDISEECIDLIDKLLTTDTKKRIKIDELFKHSWVVNKEKDYFPFYKRYKEIKSSNNDIINYHRRVETDIDYIKNLDLNLRNINNCNNNIKEDINNNKEVKINNENEQKINIINPTTKNTKNKSYCFVYTKGNTKNNGVYFIQGKSGNKNNKEEKTNNEEKEKDKNNYEFNKIILTEANKDIIIKNEKNEKTPNIHKKDIENKNNFVYCINSKRKKINLPRVIKMHKKNTENNILNTTPFISQEINRVNINVIEKANIKPEQKLEIKNYSKPKTDKKEIIRVQRKELDDYIKGQNENNDLNLKMQKIKEKQELVINKLRKIEEKKRKEESLQKLYDSQKSNTSYDYYTKNKSLKSQFSYINYKPKKDIGSYSIKKFTNANVIKPKKFINLRENLKEKRSKSFQQILSEKSLENKIKILLKDKKNKNKINDLINNINKNYMATDSFKFRNNNINKGDDDINIKENFKRFRKMVVHLKKRHFNINSDDTLYKSCESDKKLNDNKKLKTTKSNAYLKKNKAHKSIQNIFYNTFYNCLFNNEHSNNNYYYSNKKNYYKNNKNIFSKKNHIIKNKNQFKSISSEKNIFNYKKILDLNKRNNENSNILNKENKIVNYSTERKLGKIYIHPNGYIANNNNEKNITNNIYFNYKNNLLKTGMEETPSNKKEIVNEI